jgi:transposase
MHLLISSPPSRTATSSCCPQCAAVMSIRLVEPDLKDPLKARHVFECQECGLSRAYLMIAGEPSHLAARPSPRWQRDTR